MENKERICIFIDGSNFYHCSRKDFGDVNVDFQKLPQELYSKDRRLIRTYYRKQQQFFERLRKMPNFKVILVRLQKRRLDGRTYYAVN